MERPRTDTAHYAEHLGDVAYWRPWVEAVLDRHRLLGPPIEAPRVGTFPTFLVGDVVVKLFGDRFDGAESAAAERAVHELLAGHPDIPAPALVASGALFDDGHPWPYLVTERFPGRAVRELGDDVVAGIAGDVGALVARLHALPAPPEVAARDLVDELRTTAPDRLRRHGLPEHLVEQVPAYLADAEEPTTLVHADITEDHVFVDGHRLVGIIDWGDAIVADRAYELPAAHFDALRGTNLTSFLEGAGWRLDARRALQGVLEFQFDAITAVRRHIDLDAVRSLDELADRLF